MDGVFEGYAVRGCSSYLKPLMMRIIESQSSLDPDHEMHSVLIRMMKDKKLCRCSDKPLYVCVLIHT